MVAFVCSINSSSRGSNEYSDNITEYDEIDETNDLAMALTFNDYGRGRGSYHQETPIRDPETGHITRFYTNGNKQLEALIDMLTTLMMNEH